MAEKLYLTADGLLNDSFELATRVIESGFEPTIIVALWRGGVPIGVAVQELLAYAGIETDHIAIRTASYKGIGQRDHNVQVFGLNYIIKKIVREDRLLIVDDVFDTGLTIEALVAEIRRKARKNTPDDIRVAVPYYKPAHNRTEREPDYYLHTTEQWLKFPHSLEGLTVGEVEAHRPELYRIIAPLLGGTPRETG
ncbi:MAG: phosphoribosyltransferase family protein [Pseudomonadota bacterium]